MTYEIRLSRTAEKQLRKLPRSIALYLGSAMARLSTEPRPPQAKRLVGRDAFRIRAGDYRIVYEIKDDALIVVVIGIGHRKEIYRKLG